MNKDVISGLALLVFDAFYFWATQKIPTSMLDDAFGARGLPHILAALLAVLGVTIALRGFLESRRTVSALTADETADDDDHEAPLPRAVGLLLISVGYMLIMPIVGYLLAIALMIAAIALYEGAARDWRIPAAALFGGALFWLVFNYVLGVGQPSGMLFGG